MFSETPMYWFLDGQATSVLPLVLACLLWASGGWLIVSAAFCLRPGERVMVGAAVGLAIHLAAANLLAHFLPSSAAFAISAILVFGLGLGLCLRARPLCDPGDVWRDWPQIVAWALLALVFVLIGRGLGILDDRKNLALISLMANGHIPPPFYMDASTPFKYHYGSQLFGAELMSLGGMTPWSAFDGSKGILGGLSIVLAWLLGRRLTHRAAGGYAMAALMAFASGARWLLLLAPAGWIAAASKTIQLWGSGADTAASLAAALTSTWTVSGGPPVGIPFAFVNGMNEPLVLGIQAGTAPLARSLLFILLLTLRRERNAWATVAWTSTLALLALTWETDFLVFGGTLLLLAIYLRVSRRGALHGRSLQWVAASIVAAGVIALLQGGTLTEIARGVLGWGARTSAGLSLRWPPALISAHLGVLHPGRPFELMVALAEAGAVLIAAPLSLLLVRRSALRRYELAALALSAPLAALIPCVVVYAVDRDITRFTSYAFVAWFLLAVPVLWILARRLRRVAVLPIGVVWGAASILGGVVVFGALLSAAGTSIFSEAIAPVDAALTRAAWGKLDPTAMVLDSHPYRAVIVTGLRTQSTMTDFVPDATWSALVAQPDSAAIANAGYRYVYVDSWWWGAMTDAQQASFHAGCAVEVASGHDQGQNGDRWLFDLQACASG
jgi:hypothetical protein